MILIIDNYDSFVHNLGRYFTRAGEAVEIVRNDAITLQEIEAMAPEAIVVSPGPCAPQDSGISIAAIRHFGATTPILGVCLGHQAIVEAYGGRTVRHATPMHGRSSAIHHDGTGPYYGMPMPFEAGRYHSLSVALPRRHALSVTARTSDGSIMGVQHAHHPVYGMQFHPESILTQNGMMLIRNFIDIAKAYQERQNSSAA